MDHILQLQVRVEEQRQKSSPKLCDWDRGVEARSTRSADASRVTFALAAVALLALFSVAASPWPSTLPARLVAVVGSIFSSKTALFVLSNVIFVLLAVDYRCCGSAGDADSAGEPGGVLEKQAQHHQVQVQVQVQVEQCAVAVQVQSSVPCSESLADHNEQEDEGKSTMSATASTLPDEELELELVTLGEEEDSIALELEEIVYVEEPTCETAQGQDSLEISELNKKFDEFIKNRRIRWEKEEACLLLYGV